TPRCTEPKEPDEKLDIGKHSNPRCFVLVSYVQCEIPTESQEPSWNNLTIGAPKDSLGRRGLQEPRCMLCLGNGQNELALLQAIAQVEVRGLQTRFVGKPRFNRPCRDAGVSGVEAVDSACEVVIQVVRQLRTWRS